MATANEDGTISIITISDGTVIADNIDTIHLERVKADDVADPSMDDTFKVTLSENGTSRTVWVSYIIYASLRSLERARREEINRRADAHE